jgi:hypothetical protein
LDPEASRAARPLAAPAQAVAGRVTRVCVTCLALLGPILLRAEAAASLDDLTGPWQLFVDDYLVAAKSNVVRTYHPFQKYAGNPVLVADQPWEGLVYLYGTVLPDEARSGYRMWYHTLRPADTNNDGSLELYATSADGIHWFKPLLGLRSWHGSVSNNMYFTRSTAGGMTSVMHTPWESDPNLRFKLVNRDDTGYFAGWSPDGIHVLDAPSNPVFTGGSDVGQFCWDPRTRQYLGYVKNAWYDANGRKRRAVALTATTNITSWPQESLILWPDPFDDRWAPAGTAQRTHFYGLSAFPYESMYIGLLWIFRATDVDGYYVGTVFSELVSSHDGVHWTREEGERPPILPLGAAGAWDAGQVYTARAPVLAGDTLKLWYGGFNKLHGTALSSMTGSIGLATLRKDGFASLDAGATTGTILTRLLDGVGGPLLVNYQAVGGSLKTEVLNETNGVLPGYSLDECVVLSGDSVTQAVTWASHTELPVGGPRVRLRFSLQNAALYSFMAGEAVAVIDPPTITAQPASQAALSGGTARFVVTASGSAPLSYRWQRNQADLLDDGMRYSGCGTAILTINDASADDVGAYRCVVTNAHGAIVSLPAALVVGSNRFGSIALTAIAPLPGDTSNEARAMTPDGQWVVGVSGARGFLCAVDTAAVFNVVAPGAGQSTILTGVGCRMHGGVRQVVMSGLAGGWYSAFMTVSGQTFSGGVQSSGGTIKAPHIPLANGLAGTSTDVFYSAWSDDNPSDYQEYVGRFSGAWPMTPQWSVKGIPKPTPAGVNGISATGRAVGWRGNPRAAYVLDWNGTGTPTPWFLGGLDGTTAGEAFCVSSNGTTIFGQSPVRDGRPGRWGCKTVLAATMPGPAAQLSTNELPNFPDTDGAGGSGSVPYGCTADGQHAVGMSYRGAEKAVLWNTGDPNPSRWTVIDLTEAARANAQLNGFVRLARAYSVARTAAGGLVVTGSGVDAGGTSRAWLMALPAENQARAVPVGDSARAASFALLSGGGLRLTNYLEFTTNLARAVSWQTVASAACNGYLTLLEDPNPSGRQRFYRIRTE